MSPTQRTLARLRKLGYLCQIVERWQPYFKPKPGGSPGVRIDLFSCIDIVAVSEAREELLGVQACSGSSHSMRREKSLLQPGLRGWLAGGGRFEIWSWQKRGARGKRKLWEVRREAIVLLNGELLPATVCIPPPDVRAVDGTVLPAPPQGDPPLVEGSR